MLAQIADDAPGRIGAKRLGELSGLTISNSQLDGLATLHFSRANRAAGTGKELLRLVRENQVGNNVVYRIWSARSE
jgi:hypothetical protein